MLTAAKDNDLLRQWAIFRTLIQKKKCQTIVLLSLIYGRIGAKPLQLIETAQLLVASI
jgi:hypothetical protein